MSEQNYQAFWGEVLNIIHEEYRQKGQEDEFTLWFNMDYVKDTLTEITVAVPSEFMWTRMVSMGYVKAVQEKIAELTGQNVSITYIAKNKISSSSKKNLQTKNEDIKENTNTQPFKVNDENIKNESEQKPTSVYSNIYKEVESEKKQDHKAKKHPQLKEEFTFETFVPGDNSDFAYKASIAAAENPGGKFNPLLIYGGVGLGKTHLMQSIGNYIYNKKDGLVKICYVSAENFTNEFTSSIRDGSTDKFKAKYRKLDVLLIDDIHFLLGKEATQEELFYTFEALHQNNSQMVFTCDRPITELKGIEDRLRTRFSSGMSIDLQPPNYETRRAILQKELELLGKNIPSDVVDYIAKNVQTNVRDLKGCLTKMLNYSELLQRPLTIEIAQKELRDTFSQPASGAITIETIQKVVADHYNISLNDMKCKRKPKKFVIPRQIAIYITRQITEYSFPEISNEFGGRDHTTAIHSYQKIEEQLKTDSLLDTTIQMLIRKIKDYKK